jgi:hypothetical protein
MGNPESASNIQKGRQEEVIQRAERDHVADEVQVTNDSLGRTPPHPAHPLCVG